MSPSGPDSTRSICGLSTTFVSTTFQFFPNPKLGPAHKDDSGRLRSNSRQVFLKSFCLGFGEALVESLVSAILLRPTGLDPLYSYQSCRACPHDLVWATTSKIEDLELH